MATKKQLSEEISAVLRQAGLITKGESCSCDFIPSRQLAVHCVTDGGVHFFVKQLNGNHSFGDKWIEQVFSSSQFKYSQHRPRIHFNDRGWLISDFCKRTETLKKVPSDMLSSTLARTMGMALASLHSLGTAPLKNSPKLGLANPQSNVRAMPPLSLSSYAEMPGLDRDIYVRYSQGCAEGISILSDQLSYNSPIHGDLQGGNILITLSENNAFHIVDWERASPGDPCWDLGHLLAALLQRWIRTINDLTPPLDEILSLRQGTWPPQASWYTQLLNTYITELPELTRHEVSAAKISRIAGHTILERCRNILYVRGIYSGRDVLMLAIAEKLVNQPEQTLLSLLPGLKLGEAEL